GLAVRGIAAVESRAIPGSHPPLEVAVGAGEHEVALTKHIVEGRIAVRAARLGAWDRVRNRIARRRRRGRGRLRLTRGGGGWRRLRGDRARSECEQAERGSADAPGAGTRAACGAAHGVAVAVAVCTRCAIACARSCTAMA